MISTMKDKFKKIFVSAVSIFFWVLLWHIAATIANTRLLFKIPLPIDTVKELVILSNIDKKALGEIETYITEYMMEEKKKYTKEA